MRKRIQPPEFGLALHQRTTSTHAHESRTHTHCHGTPEPLTQPVFAGNLAKSLPVGLPSSEEVDRAVLPALDHLHEPGAAAWERGRERGKKQSQGVGVGGQSSNGIHRAYAAFDPPLRALSHPPGRALPMLIWNQTK